MQRIFAILLMLTGLCYASAQEFHCTAQVNHQKLLTTTQPYPSDGDQKVFESMKQAIEDFVGGRKWSNIDFEPSERLECSVGLVLNSRTSATAFAGQLQIQLRRPVYNSTYTTGLFNYMEQSFSFSYNESQPLDFDLTNFYGTLQSTLAYYCYIMLGIYFDSYAVGGGEPFFTLAQQVVQAVDVNAASGWDANNGRNRYWFVENHTNGAYSMLHEAYYNYHRMGLDMMTKDQTKARANIIAALDGLQEVAKIKPNLLSVQQFVDVKIEELIAIFTPAPAKEKKRVYDIVRTISPINASKISSFNTQ